MAYDRIGGQRYALESVNGGSSPGVLMMVVGILVAVGGAFFVIGPGQYMDEREFVVTLAFIFGGGASMLGSFLLGAHHGGRPTVITQPEVLAIDEPGVEHRRLHADARSFPIEEVQRVELQHMRLVHHDVESASSSEHHVYVIAIILRRNVIELSFRDADEAGRHAKELAERLGRSAPDVRPRPAPIGTGLLGALVIVSGVIGLMAVTVTGVMLAGKLQPLDILRVAGYVVAFTLATYVLARAARRLTLRGWVGTVYRLES